METWKQIQKYPSYEVSSLGRVRHIKHQKIRKTRSDKFGYRRISLHNPVTGKLDAIRIHRLVGMAFLELDPDSVVDHIDGDRVNNRLSNLRATTISGNASNRTKVTAQKIRRIIDLHQKGFTPEQILSQVV